MIFNVELSGIDELKEKVQYFKHLSNEMEKTLNFISGYKFNLSIRNCSADLLSNSCQEE